MFIRQMRISEAKGVYTHHKRSKTRRRVLIVLVATSEPYFKHVISNVIQKMGCDYLQD